MTKDTEKFSQLTDSVACREYTLPRDENSSETKGWIRVNTKIGPVLGVTTCYLQGKHGVEIRIESIKKDHSHSWVRISHGLNKLVTDLSNMDHDDNEQETSEMQFEDCALKSIVLAFASRSKAKAKPQRHFCQLIHKNCTHWRKNLDRYCTKRLFLHRLSSVEATEHSSSTLSNDTTRR